MEQFAVFIQHAQSCGLPQRNGGGEVAFGAKLLADMVFGMSGGEPDDARAQPRGGFDGIGVETACIMVQSERTEEDGLPHKSVHILNALGGAAIMVFDDGAVHVCSSIFLIGFDAVRESASFWATCVVHWRGAAGCQFICACVKKSGSYPVSHCKNSLKTADKRLTGRNLLLLKETKCKQ